MRQRNGRSLHCTFCKKYLKVMLSLVLNMSYSDGMSGYKLVNSDVKSGYKLVKSDVISLITLLCLVISVLIVML
jgi:hypothetical protein